MDDDALIAFANALEVPPLDRREVATVLSVAREVAHATERRHAPLTAYLLGIAVASADDRPGALERAARTVRERVADGGTPDGSD